MNKIILSNGVEIPQIGLGVYLGYGVFENPDSSLTIDSVKSALEVGYRHIDMAAAYGNESDVGIAIKESGVPREELFLTTKLWNDDIVARRAKEGFEESLKKLQTDYLDLYLLHWPIDGMEEAWSVLEDLYLEKRIKAIGVSNFQMHHMKQLMKHARIKPMVNQIESNPYNNNQKLVDDCRLEDIQIEAWSPLGGSGGNILQNPALKDLAEKYNKSVAQIILRWNIQRGIVVLPKSIHKERQVSNMEVFDFVLSDEDMRTIFRMNKNISAGTPPKGVYE